MKKKVLRETSNTKKNKFQTSMIRPKDVLSSKILHHNLKVLGISIKLLSQIIVDYSVYMKDCVKKEVKETINYLNLAIRKMRISMFTHRNAKDN
ncbi:hypothetical protein HZH66_003611 [Vespula vulgaris]|uniref:Uncharacterized protein n=1 Tax=Vespula vulgaris TaxID=7454 RepID=A0A834ND86_VESVU|nr:hypothetical protein HZH66_003611 [Vespula vulgaris]